LGWKAAEVLPLDDHAIVRGHAVFDTCTLASGCVYRWDSLVGPSPDHLSGWRSIQQSLGSPRAFMNYIILYVISYIIYLSGFFPIGATKLDSDPKKMEKSHEFTNSFGSRFDFSIF